MKKIVNPGRLLACLLSMVVARQVNARDQIWLVGSSETPGSTQPVAEQFSQHWGNRSPSVLVTGTGAGFKLFCSGVGIDHPEAVVTARRITEAERSHCKNQGIMDITEIEIARDAMVIINTGSRAQINPGLEHLFAALAAQTPSDNVLVDNIAKRWSDIDPRLPAVDISVMIPAPSSTAAITLQELALPGGCKAYPGLLKPEDADRERVCRTLRRDGHVSNGPRREDSIIAWLEKNKHGYAVTNYATYKYFARRSAVNLIEGVAPTEETVANKHYPLVTGLYIHVKDDRVELIPGLQQYLYELASEHALASGGYLIEQGLVNLNDIGRNKARDNVLGVGM